MSKKALGSIIVACLGFLAIVGVFLYRSAENARKRSDIIMQQFKDADRVLEEGRLRIDSLNNTASDSLNFNK